MTADSQLNSSSSGSEMCEMCKKYPYGFGRGACGCQIKSPAPLTAKEETPPDQGCTIPPEGWYCSRKPGHDGPCAARAVVSERGRPRSIECCVQCGEPKDTRNVKVGDEVANGWPACTNPSCVAFGESMASAWYRPASLPSASEGKPPEWAHEDFIVDRPSASEITEETPVRATEKRELFPETLVRAWVNSLAENHTGYDWSYDDRLGKFVVILRLPNELARASQPTSASEITEAIAELEVAVANNQNAPNTSVRALLYQGVLRARSRLETLYRTLELERDSWRNNARDTEGARLNLAAQLSSLKDSQLTPEEAQHLKTKVSVNLPAHGCEVCDAILAKLEISATKGTAEK